MRPPIHFAIIGAQKSGTTSLHQYLQSHPRIFLPERKEIAYFAPEGDYRVGVSDLAAHYADLRDEPVVGLSFVGMMFVPGTSARLHAYNREMKLVAVLRNPTERAYSAYWYHRRTGWEEAESFEEALRRESATSPDESADARARSLWYRRNGCYREQLQPFVEQFGRERLRLLLTEDLRAAPGDTVEATARWLGAGGGTPVAAGERHNEAAMPRFQGLQRSLMATDSVAKRVYHTLVPEAIRDPLRRHVTQRVLRANERSFRYPPMRPETRAELDEFYAPHNRRLEQFLGRTLDGWSGSEKFEWE